MYSIVSRFRCMRVQARRRILGHKHCKLPADRPVFFQSGLRTDSIFGQVRDTTVQVWTVGEGFGITSEFSQTCCGANNFRDHEILLPWFKGATATKQAAPHWSETHGTSPVRSPSVLAHYCTLTWIGFGFFATALFGK